MVCLSRIVVFLTFATVVYGVETLKAAVAERAEGHCRNEAATASVAFTDLRSAGWLLRDGGDWKDDHLHLVGAAADCPSELQSSGVGNVWADA